MRLFTFITLMISYLSVYSQNIGINNTNPKASLDIKGDVIFRVDTLELVNGVNDNIDINTSRSMNYVITGPSTTFELGGFAGGRNGRIITLYNSSPAAYYVKSYSAGSAAVNQINTGTGADFTMNSYSTITLQYLAADSLWHVVSRYGDVGGSWAINGNNIFNTNTENVGIGVSAPSEKLDVAGHINIVGEIKNNGIGGQSGEVLTSLGNGSMQWIQAQNSESNTGYGSWGDCTVNNISHFQPVVNEDAMQGDVFGQSVSISGDYAIVGAEADDENGFTNIGSASIYKKNASTAVWEFRNKIINENPADDKFGYSVSISGDYAIVGAYSDDENGFTNNGSASIFKRNASTGVWEFQTKLINQNPATGDNFGYSVSIAGDYAIVGAYLDDENGFTNNGSASIYRRNASTGVWEFQTKLINENPGSGDIFGYCVSINGDYAIVGAKDDDENGFTNNGSASIFLRNSSTGVWEFQTKLTNQYPATGDYFGSSVSISGDYAIVGAYSDDENGFSENGSASIYNRNTSTGVWQVQIKLINQNPATFDYFGYSVSISGDYAIVGAYADEENGISGIGSTSIYKRLGNFWIPIQKFSRPNGQNFEYFGSSVAINGNNKEFLIGSYRFSDYAGLVSFGKVK